MSHGWCLLAWEAQYTINRDNLICHAFAGWATEAEVEAHIAKLQRLDGGVQEWGL